MTTVLVLGADGYLGHPTCLHLAMRGYDVWAVDSFAKRLWENAVGVEPLRPVPPANSRFREWNERGRGSPIHFRTCDLLNQREIYKMLEACRPDAIIHYAEQPSAPFSQMGREQAVETQHNNVVGNLNLLFGMMKYCPDAHLIKLGTMGEYGTPNIDIEEGWLEVEHKGRKDRMLYPKKPGSFYHLSKVHDSHNIEFTCRIWGLRATDLNQGVVYGVETEETKDLSFHYDAIFGTALNRFVVQAATNNPITVYGKGGQTRGFLNIKDTLQCVELAVLNPAARGEFRVFNQFTEQFSVLQLAEKVRDVARAKGLRGKINHIANPRVEMDEHYYNAKHTGLLELGLQPHLLDDETIGRMLDFALANKHSVKPASLMPDVRWKS